MNIHFTLCKCEFLIVFAIFLLVYLWFRYKFTYWTRRKVCGPPPVFPFGNVRDVIRRKQQFFQPYYDCYFKYKHLPYVGLYSFHRPVLSINDPEIAKLILIKDFDYFQAHGIFAGGVGDPLAGHLFNIHGEPWRNLRSKMSPIFTSGKLKAIYPLIQNVSDEALKYIGALHSDGVSVNFSDFYAKYSMEIIGSVGFGLECNGFNNSDSEFYRRGFEYFEPKSVYWTFVRAFAFFAPDLFNLLKIKRIDSDIIMFFYNLVKETVQYRKKHNYRRNDFLQTLIELNEQITEKQVPGEGENDNLSFTMDHIAANTMLYMFAGYETSATVGQFAAFELALNPDIQAKAREEILDVLSKHGGDLNFEAQNEMVYMNMILDETMRIHPPMRALFRRCTRNYKLVERNLEIEEGTLVFVPNQAIQMDPEIFPDPEKFDPQRFSKANKLKIHPCYWMPFGEGPRKCLGLRQGYIQSKMALVKILQRYELSLDNRTSVPLRIKSSSLAYAAETGIWIKLKKI